MAHEWRWRRPGGKKIETYLGSRVGPSAHILSAPRKRTVVVHRMYTGTSAQDDRNESCIGPVPAYRTGPNTGSGGSRRTA